MAPPPRRSSCHGRFPPAEAFGRSLDQRGYRGACDRAGGRGGRGQRQYGEERRHDRSANAYTYRFNGRDGTFALIDILDPAGRVVATLHYWDSPDTDEADRAEESARLVCEQLSRWQAGPDPAG